MEAPRLIVWFDPLGRIMPIKSPPGGMKQAVLDLPDGIEGRDIYEVARKLAELLLEQLA